MMIRPGAISALLGFAFFATAVPSIADDLPPSGVDLDVRSGMKIVMDEILAGTVFLPDLYSSPTYLDIVHQLQLRGDNVQANFPSGDYVQQFPGFRPFVHATQSEVSTAAFGKNIVLGYNNSAGLHVSPNPSGPGLVVDRVQLSGFATSNDGGHSWVNGFLPPSHNASQTFGDPSVGVDRHGVFYYATLAADASGKAAIQVNVSADGGATWGEGVIVQQDDGSDKEWLAVGPDPVNKDRDNVYVTWTSFQSSGLFPSELRFGRSTDGGATWTAKTIFTPTADPNPANPQNGLTYSNPVVDSVTGTLYVPFLRFSHRAQDFIQMMVSRDAGETFQFLTFNVPGAPSPTVLPVTQPGEATACGANDNRLTIHGTANAGPGKHGLPRYINASRLTLQPAAAVRNDIVYLAWSNSASFVFGSSAGSNVWFVRSDDGGQSWNAPVMVNPTVSADKHHVLPSLAIDRDPNDVHVSYYTQHADSSVDLDMANSHDRGNTFPANRTVRITATSFNLPPSNIPLSDAPNFNATNYDRQIAVCYGLGEYQSVTTANGSVYVGWGDARNQITEPMDPRDPISGQTHPQQDVFFQTVKAQ